MTRSIPAHRKAACLAAWLLLAPGLFLSMPGCSKVTPDPVEETPVDKPDTPEEPEVPTLFSGGDGSAAKPYIIANKKDLTLFLDKCNDAESAAEFSARAYRQIADIDLGGAELTSVGTRTPFTGTYDGDGHAIRNYTANGTGSFFASIKNATLSGISLEPGHPLSFSGPDCGALVGQIEAGVVDGCRFTGEVSSSEPGAGGLAGRLLDGQIVNCSVNATVTSTAKVLVDNEQGCSVAGGIVGSIDGGSVEHCTFSGSVTASGKRVAGICALVSGGTLLDCVASGSIHGVSHVGGIAGMARIGTSPASFCSVLSCRSEATVTASDHTAAGILANLSATGSAPLTMDRCVNTGNVSSLYNCAGILGFATSSGGGATLMNCTTRNCVLSTSGSDPSNIAYTRIGGILGGTAKASTAFLNILNSCTYSITLKTTATGKNGTVSAIAGIAGSLYSPGGIYGCYSQLQFSDIIIPKTVTYKGAIVGYKASTANIGANCVFDSANSYGAFYNTNPAVGIATASFLDGTLLAMMNGFATGIEGAAAWEAGEAGYPVPTGKVVGGSDDSRPTVRILGIGNSFTRDAIEYFLYDIFNAAGYNAILGNVYIGGCTLQTHWENETSTNETTRNSNSYRKIVKGVRTVVADKSIAYCVEDEPWDIIILQQGQGLYGIVESHYPYLDNLIAYAKTHLSNKNCKFGYQQTWALSAHSTNNRFSLYDRDQLKMYQACVDCAEALRTRSALDYIVPTGTAIQNGRNTSLGDTFLNPSDELHLNTTYGAFTASCTWFETFTGVDVTTNAFCPPGVNAATATLCRKAAHQAVLHPTVVTKVE